MVSISWYLSENVRVEMSKTQHFEKFEKVICSELAAKVYIYVCIYTDMGTGRKRRENEDHSWTMESPPTRYRAGRGSTAGMASDMIGPRWKRRSFVDDGTLLPTWLRKPPACLALPCPLLQIDNPNRATCCMNLGLGLGPGF